MPEESYLGIHQTEYESKCAWALNHRLFSLHRNTPKIKIVSLCFPDSRENVEERTRLEYGVEGCAENWPKYEPDPCAACVYDWI